jgi:AcrR family transcriptional regulator
MRVPVSGAVGCWRAMGEPLSREAIVAATRPLIESEGLDAVSLRRVATTLGVTAPALYAHVAGKRDLLRAVAEGEFRRLLDRFASVDDPDPLARVRRLCHAYVDHALDSPELFRTMFLFRPDLAVGGAAGEELPLATAAFDTAMAALTDAVTAGALRPVDPLMAALALWAAVHGAAEVVLMGFDFDPVTRQALVDAVVDTMLAGLSS